MHFRLCTLCLPRQVQPRPQKVMLQFKTFQLKPPPVSGLKDASLSSKVFLQLQTLTSDSHEILLDNTSPLSEIVEVWDPARKKYTPWLIQYDSGGGLCFIQDGKHLNMLPTAQKTEAVELQCVNGTAEVSYDVIQVTIRTQDSSI